jgi:hypothetical protein
MNEDDGSEAHHGRDGRSPFGKGLLKTNAATISAASSIGFDATTLRTPLGQSTCLCFLNNDAIAWGGWSLRQSSGGLCFADSHLQLSMNTTHAHRMDSVGSTRGSPSRYMCPVIRGKVGLEPCFQKERPSPGSHLCCLMLPSTYGRRNSHTGTPNNRTSRIVIPCLVSR